MKQFPSLKGRKIGFIRVNKLDRDRHNQIEGMQLDMVFKDVTILKKQFLSQLAIILNRTLGNENN